MKIALIAHDGKKSEMISFVLQNRDIFINNQIVATGTTGKMIKQNAKLDVECLLSGPLGGDAQIASQVANKEIDIVIFFRDPLDKHPHEPDVQMLMRICDVHNVPLITNPAGAIMVLNHLRDKNMLNKFIEMVKNNIDNDSISDTQFRELIKSTLMGI
jgi:methylglyoxal synthase